eukprot:5188633-Pleurochrysis_carterae.AAC.2
MSLPFGRGGKLEGASMREACSWSLSMLACVLPNMFAKRAKTLPEAGKVHAMHSTSLAACLHAGGLKTVATSSSLFGLALSASSWAEPAPACAKATRRCCMGLHIESSGAVYLHDTSA